jgi:16S rRNA (guanine(966)-N(2))-methyltransferase RsmD
MLREALFSIWQGQVQGATFLDLFAGAGSVGLEALSRGARRVVFVDQRGRGLPILSRNCRSLAEDGWQVLSADLPRELTRLRGTGPWDLVFADPPYEFTAFEALLSGVEDLLAVSGHLAIEHSTRRTPPDASGLLEAIERREYGESTITIYRKSQ